MYYLFEERGTCVQKRKGAGADDLIPPKTTCSRLSVPRKAIEMGEINCRFVGTW